MRTNTQNREPLRMSSSFLNKIGPSILSRNFNSKVIATSKDKSVRFSNSPARYSGVKKSSNLAVQSKPQNIRPILQTEVIVEQEVPKQSNNIEELLKTTNRSLNQLREELGRLESIKNKEKENIKNDFSVKYHEYSQKDLVLELREKNHQLVMDDLKTKSDIMRLKDFSTSVITDNQLLRERITTEKTKGELFSLEMDKLSKTIAELNGRIQYLQNNQLSSLDKCESQLELTRKEEILKSINEQIDMERGSKKMVVSELNLELARNGKLQIENQKLKLSTQDLQTSLHELRKDIRYQKAANQEMLFLLRYR